MTSRILVRRETIKEAGNMVNMNLEGVARPSGRERLRPSGRHQPPNEAANLRGAFGYRGKTTAMWFSR